MTKILVYGTLRRHERGNALMKGVEYLGDVRVPGYDMYNLGGFPGIVENPDNKEGIVGEVFDGIDDALLEQLDFYEAYYPERPDASGYLRKEIDIGGDKMFVYVFNQLTDKMWYLPVPSGDWKDR